MILTIDGHIIPLPPRIAAMILHLVDHAVEIEALSSAHIELHYSPFQVKYYPPCVPEVRKVDLKVNG